MASRPRQRPIARIALRASSAARRGIAGRSRPAELFEPRAQARLQWGEYRVGGPVLEFVGVELQVVELLLRRLVEDVLVPPAAQGAVGRHVALGLPDEVLDEEVVPPGWATTRQQRQQAPPLRARQRPARERREGRGEVDVRASTGRTGSRAGRGSTPRRGRACARRSRGAVRSARLRSADVTSDGQDIGQKFSTRPPGRWPSQGTRSIAWERKPVLAIRAATACCPISTVSPGRLSGEIRKVEQSNRRRHLAGIRSGPPRQDKPERRQQDRSSARPMQGTRKAANPPRTAPD
jgi:hypothetical protein